MYVNINPSSLLDQSIDQRISSKMNYDWGVIVYWSLNEHQSVHPSTIYIEVCLSAAVSV